MATNDGPDETGPDQSRKSAGGTDPLDQRRRDLGAAIQARRSAGPAGADDRKPGATAGYGQAFKLSSEFIAAIVVGAVMGWLIDYAAGTSPWGLIIFLLLGFCAGVLNVLRSTGQVAEFGRKKKR